MKEGGENDGDGHLILRGPSRKEDLDRGCDMAAALTRTDPLRAFQRMLSVLLTFARTRRRRRGSVGRKEKRRNQKSDLDQDQDQNQVQVQDPGEEEHQGQDGLDGKEGQGSSKGR